MPRLLDGLPRGKLTLAKKLCRDREPNGEEPGLSSYRGRVRQQPRCPRAPRAGYETTWRRLMRAWLGPKPGSLSIRRSIQRGNARQLPANCRKLRALKRQLRRYARSYPRLYEAAPAERGGGCGGTRSRQQAWSYAERATDLPANDEPSPQTRQDRGAVPISAASSTALPGEPCFNSIASVSAPASRGSWLSGRRPSRLAPGTSLSTRSRRRGAGRWRRASEAARLCGRSLSNPVPAITTTMSRSSSTRTVRSEVSLMMGHQTDPTS